MEIEIIYSIFSAQMSIQVFGSDSVLDLMLNNAQGEQWKVLRVIMSPAFSTGKLKLVCCFSLFEANSNQVVRKYIRTKSTFCSINNKKLFKKFQLKNEVTYSGNWTHNGVFHKLEEIGNNANIGIRDFTMWK